jgi:hydrogenase nickel incorporation protein HypA/HybF
MHEFALVRSLLAQVSQIVEADGGGPVQQVRVRCGPLAGVEPTLMQEAFTLLRSGSSFAEAELLVIEEPLLARCRQCDYEFEPQRFRFHCPRCRSPDTITESGDAVMIESVVVGGTT